MPDTGQRDALLSSLEKVRGSAKRLESEVMALHQSVRFDRHSPGAKECARKVDGALEQLAAALRRFWELFEEEPRREAG